MKRPDCELLAVAMFLAATSAAAAPLPHFPPNAVWHRNISNAPLRPDSGTIIETLNSLGGWGNGNKFQIDFSMVVNHAAPGAPTLPITPEPGYYTPDCDLPDGFNFPLPTGGAMEGSAGYTCPNGNEDCHLLVVQGDTLYESYSTTLDGQGNLRSLCALAWDLRKVYPPQGRGEQCTSADAAGFPIAPLLFGADETWAALPENGGLGYLDHAIRFILPNARIAAGVYAHPATHAGSPQGPANSVRYGARLRLRADFPLAAYNSAAQVLLRTMQQYGIVLSDGGNIALTGEDDRFSMHKWSELGITPQMFTPGTGNPAVQVTDFNVVQTGDAIGLTYSCVRVPDDFVFIDLFEY